MSNEEIEDELFELFGFCHCGCPYIVTSCIKRYLREIKKDILERNELPEDEAYYLAAYLCDKHGLTDHGVSIRGAFLTDLGEKWLEKLEGHKEEE